MGGRGGYGSKLSAVINSSPRTMQISGTVYFDDGVHIPTTHRQKEISTLLSGIDDIVVQVNNDKQGDIFYGHVPEECDWNVIRIEPHYDEIVKRRKAKQNAKVPVHARNP